MGYQSLHIKLLHSYILLLLVITSRNEAENRLIKIGHEKGALLYALGAVLSVNAEACDGCSNVCSLFSPPSEGLFCYEGNPNNAKRSYNSGPFTGAEVAWCCSNCSDRGFENYLGKAPGYESMGLWASNVSPSTESVAQGSSTITFTSKIDLKGASSDNFDATSQAVLLNVTASSMNIPLSTMLYIATLNSPLIAPRHFAEQDFWDLSAVIKTKIALSSTSYKNASHLYDNLVASLATSVESGAYNTQLRMISVLFGATQLLHANVTSVSSGPFSLNNGTVDDRVKRKTGGGGLEMEIIWISGLIVLIAAIISVNRYCCAAQSEANMGAATATSNASTTSNHYRRTNIVDRN